MRGLFLLPKTMKKRLHKTSGNDEERLRFCIGYSTETIHFKNIRAVNAVKPCCQTSANDEEMPTESMLSGGRLIGEIHIVPKQ